MFPGPVGLKRLFSMFVETQKEFACTFLFRRGGKSSPVLRFFPEFYQISTISMLVLFEVPWLSRQCICVSIRS